MVRAWRAQQPQLEACIPTLRDPDTQVAAREQKALATGAVAAMRPACALGDPGREGALEYSLRPII